MSRESWSEMKDRSFEIKGADGNPIYIKEGEYYFNTKARTRRMMTNSLSAVARRVHACLELATMGWSREKALWGKKNLTTSEIMRQTQLAKYEVHRGYSELTDAGLMVRRAVNGGSLHKGNVEIYSWAEPHPEMEKKGSARATFPEWFPPSWEPLKPFINRLKIQLPANLGSAREDLLEEGAQIARDYQKAEERARALMERVRAGADSGPIKDSKDILKDKEASPGPPEPSVVIDIEKTINPPPPPFAPVAAEGKAEEEDGCSLPEKFKAQYPADHFDEGKAMQIFNSRKKPEQRKILDRLEVYRSCQRWQDDDGRWIPLASNWLKTCEAEPPPSVKKGKINGNRPSMEDIDAQIKAALAAEDAQIAARGGGHR
jgi:hypothetical protein